MCLQKLHNAKVEAEEQQARASKEAAEQDAKVRLTSLCSDAAHTGTCACMAQRQLR